MSEAFIGEIRIYGFNFPPRGWAMCNGQILSISQNTALFALIGTTYGGNGQTTFALPNLQSRVPVHFGQGPGLSPYPIGETSGSETVTLNQNQLPVHGHTVSASSVAPNASRPGNAFLAANGAYQAAADGTTMNPGMVSGGGSNQPFGILQPFLALNFSICLEGLFPSRN
ncbi:MAG TPA: tail fiber protein [Acidimicrobiales bacterium]